MKIIRVVLQLRIRWTTKMTMMTKVMLSSWAATPSVPSGRLDVKTRMIQKHLTSAVRAAIDKLSR